MSKTAMNILTVVLIIALAIWAIYTYKACQEQKTTPVDDPVETTDNGLADDSDTLSLDDLYEDDSEDDTDGGLSSNEDSTIDPDEDDAETDTTNPPGGKIPDSATSNDGAFLIIVGAFLSRESAEKVVNRLNQLGFNAERRVFLSSDYHSVIVGNYEDLNDAYRDTKKIKDAGFPDAYAHKKRLPKKK